MIAASGEARWSSRFIVMEGVGFWHALSGDLEDSRRIFLRSFTEAYFLLGS